MDSRSGFLAKSIPCNEITPPDLDSPAIHMHASLVNTDYHTVNTCSNIRAAARGGGGGGGCSPEL